MSEQDLSKLISDLNRLGGGIFPGNSILSGGNGGAAIAGYYNFLAGREIRIGLERLADAVEGKSKHE